MNEETIGARLRRLRIERGLAQRELGSPGVSHAFISRIEAGSRQPSVKALRVLAFKLGVSVEYLETGAEETITDARADMLAERATGDLFRVLRRPEGWVVRWTSTDKSFRRKRWEVCAGNLTEALREALAVDSLHEALHARAAELRDELAAVEKNLGPQ